MIFLSQIIILLLSYHSTFDAIIKTVKQVINFSSICARRTTKICVTSSSTILCISLTLSNKKTCCLENIFFLSKTGIQLLCAHKAQWAYIIVFARNWTKVMISPQRMLLFQIERLHSDGGSYILFVGTYFKFSLPQQCTDDILSLIHIRTVCTHMFSRKTL